MLSINFPLTFLFLCSISFHTSAQLGSLIKSIDEFDLIIGPSMVDIRGTGIWFETGQQKIKIGYAAGIGIRYKLRNKMLLGGKIHFDRKGMKREYETIYVDSNVEKKGIVQFTYNFDYITLPIHFRYLLNEGKSNFYVEGGPYIGYLLKVQSISNYITRNVKQVNDETKNYKRLDFGVSLGIGYQVHLTGKHKINFQLIDYLGTVPINDWSGNNLYSNGLSFLVGLTFLK